MQKKTQDDLLAVLASLNAISDDDDLSPREREIIYNLYGHVGQTLKTILPTTDPDSYDD